jgi:hypothetical protein
MIGKLRKLWELIDTNNNSIRARYIRSVANVWTDTLIRETDKQYWQLDPRIFIYLDSLWPPHSINKFATQGNTNPPLQCNNARWRDPTAEAVDCLHRPDRL